MIGKLVYVLIAAMLISVTATASAHGKSDGNDLLTTAERIWLTDNISRIVLAVETGYPPFVFLDSKAQPTGLAHDYIFLLQSKLGVNFKQKQYSSLDDIFSNVRSGEVQIVNAVTKTPDRAAFLSFTDSFISVPNVIVVRKERAGQMLEKDLTGLKVSLVKSYAITEHLLKDGPALTADLVPDDLTAILNVSFGHADAAVVDLATASHLISHKSITNLRVAGETTLGIQLSIGVPHSEAVLLEILQKGLNAITAAERFKIHERWIHTSGASILADRRFKTAVTGLSAALFAVISGFILWNRTLRRQVALRTEDLTSEKEALRLSEEQHRSIIQTAISGFWLADMQGRLLEVNESYCRMSGYSEQELLSMRISDLEAFESSDDVALRIRRIREHGLERFESRHRRKDGSLYDVEVNVRYRQDQGGQFVTFIRDISERKRAAEALSNERAFLRSLIDSASDLIYFKDLDGTYLGCNKASEKMTGISKYEQTGKTDFDFFDCQVAELIREHDRKVLQGNTALRTEEWAAFSRTGRRVLLDTVKTPIFGPDGRQMGLVGISRDITDSKLAEEALHRSEQHFRAIIESIPVPLALNDELGNITFLNKAFVTTIGYSTDDIRTLSDWWPRAYPDPHYRQWVADSWHKNLDDAKRAGKAFTPMEVNIVCSDGASRTFMCSAAPLEENFAGTHLVILYDITERNQAESERQKLEQQLHQSQKIEAVGRLAGGVAHDFNNMLSVIIGYAELAIIKMNSSDPYYTNFIEIRSAAERSADLTRQLLAFARKQTIAPRVIDLNETVSGMLKMLQRLIGEDMHLVWRPAPNLWRVKVDPSQVDQMLANLCVNARDAIRGVGRITIETGNSSFDSHYGETHSDVDPGEYVRLVVSDDGKGMDGETLAHIFEPFFTTKGVGEGTGLGLATVFGIVKQNKGFITVDSKPEQGTTFAIYLPRLSGEKCDALQESPVKQILRGKETILVVEDEPTILRLAALMLEGQGYKVLMSATAAEAISLFRERAGSIQLLITDVVMPEMNGRDLLKELQSADPALKGLFMSGYTADVIAHHGVLDEGVHFIQKPFTLPLLAEKVREVLDE